MRVWDWSPAQVNSATRRRLDGLELRKPQIVLNQAHFAARTSTCGQSSDLGFFNQRKESLVDSADVRGPHF